jgi:DNA-binding NtrC family response regulator
MKQIYVVDDDDNIRELLLRFMEELGYESSSAPNGEEALAHLKSNRPDMLLLDILMPGMSGLDVLQEAMKIYPDLPVIMISGFADEDMAKDALSLGAYDFFLKPFSLETIKKVLAMKLDMVEIESVGN